MLVGSPERLVFQGRNLGIPTRCLQDLGSHLSVSLPWEDAQTVKHLPWELCGDIRILQEVLGCPGEMLWCCSEMRECCGEMPGSSRKMPCGDSWVPALMVFCSREVLGCSWEILRWHGRSFREILVFPGEMVAFPREVLGFSSKVPECSLEKSV